MLTNAQPSPTPLGPRRHDGGEIEPWPSIEESALAEQSLYKKPAPHRAAIKRVCAALDASGFALVRLGDLGVDLGHTGKIAEGLVRDIAELLQQTHQLGDALFCEPDEIEGAPSAGGEDDPGLPRHASQPSSFLTPTKLHLVSWDESLRTFSTTDDGAQGSHTLYRAVFVDATGEAPCIASYYELPDLLTAAFTHGCGRAPRDLRDLLSWYAGNVQHCFEARAQRDRASALSRSPNLGILLGSRLPFLPYVSFDAGAADLAPGLLDEFPELPELVERCACGGCRGAAASVFCHVVHGCFGLGWGVLRPLFETRVETVPGDLLIHNNLRLLHGGARGSAFVRPWPIRVCLTRAAGEPYERWLARAWRGSRG